MQFVGSNIGLSFHTSLYLPTSVLYFDQVHMDKGLKEDTIVLHSDDVLFAPNNVSVNTVTSPILSVKRTVIE